MDIGVDINQNHDKSLNKAVAHQNASTPNTSPCSTSSESPTDSKKIKLPDNDFHDDSIFGDHVDDDDDSYEVDNDDDDDEGSSSVSSEEGSVKRRIARWERRLSQAEDLDVTAPVNQGQASPELGRRDLPAPVVIPPTFLHDHGSVSLRENSQAENELSFVRANVIRMKADFQMTELKLSNAKWQYDVNKGTKRPVRSQKRNPALNWSSDNVSLPDIPENMAARRRGEGSPSTAHQMNLASFGNDGRRRDTSGQHRVVNQRILSSPGGQNPRAMMSQSSPSLIPSYGSQRHVLSSAKTNQQAITSPSLPARNTYGLETMELKLKNMNKQVEKVPSPHQRTLVAPLKSFVGTQQNSQIIRGSGGMESHGYQTDHQRRSERPGTSNIPTSHSIPSPRTIIQRGIDERANQGTPHGYQMNHHQGFERSGTTNIQTSHSLPSPRTMIQRGIAERTNEGTPHGSQRDHHQRFERPGTSNIQPSHSIPSPRTIIQSGIAERTNQGTPHGSQRDHHQGFERPGTSNIPTSRSIPSPGTIIQRGIAERTNQGTPYGSQRFERSGTSNIPTSHSIPSPETIIQRGIAERTNEGTPHGSQRDHHQRFERPGTSNIQTSHSVPKTRTILQDDFVARTNQDPYHGYQRNHQQRLEKPGTSHSVPSTRTLVQNDIAVRANQGTSYGYQRDSQHNFQTSETSNVQRSHSVPNARIIPQDVIAARTNQDLADLKLERERLLNELGDILLDDVAQQDEMEEEEEMSSGGISDGSSYDFDDSWDMETSESPVDTNDVGTQFPYPDEGGSSRDTFEAIESMQDESQCFIDGSDEIFQSSDCTFDVCIQVSVRTTTKTTPDRFPDAIHTQDNFENQNELVVDHIDTAGDIQFDNLELQEDTPSMTPLPETGNTMNEQHPSEEAVEDLVLALNHPNDNAQVSAVGVNRGIELEKLSQEMDCCNESVEEQPKQAPGFLSHVDETSVNNQSGTKKVVVEEFIPLRKCLKNTVQFSAVGAHHDDLMEELAQEMEIENTNVSPEQRERTSETVPHVDETSVESKRVVDELVPRVKASHDNSQLCAIFADHDDVFSAIAAHHEVLEKPTNEMDTCNIPERMDGSEPFVDGDLNISAVDIKSDHAEPQEQLANTSSRLDQSPMTNQTDIKKTAEEEFVPRLNSSSLDLRVSADNGHSDDGLESPTQEMKKCNNTANGDPEELHSTDDLPAESHPSSELHISENVYDQADPMKETRLDERSSQRLEDTSKEVVEEFVQSLKLPHDEAELNTNDAHHNNVLEKLAEEIYKSSNPVVSAEQEMKLTASDRSDLYDDKTPVQDNFCEFRAGDNKQSLNLSKLSSPVEEDNASLVQTKISVGSPPVETAQISSSKDQFNGSDQISHCRVENEAESRENDGMVSVDSEDPVTPNALATIPNPPLEFDFPLLPTLVEDSNESTEEKDLLPQGASNVPAAPRDSDDKPDTDQKNSEQLSISLDVSAAFENELAFDDLSKDGTRLKDNDDAANQRSPKDINVKDSGVMEPLSPRRSKIPIPKSKLSRSKSCPTRNRSNKKVHKQNSQTPKDKEGALNKRPISDKTLPVNVKTTSPTFVNSFPFRHDRSRRSLKGDTQQNSRIPVPTSNFKRTGSCPSRPRPRIVELNAMSLSNKSKRVPNLTPPTPATRDNTSKTRSRDIDITKALAICEKEAVQGDDESTREIESRISDVGNSSILLGEKPNDLAADDVQSLNALPSETEEFIQRAKQILSRLPISQTNVPKTRSVPFGIKPTAREESHESKDVKGPPGEVPYADYPAVSSPEMDIEFLALEADAEEDTASDTFTLHSDNDFDIQSPLYDEVLKIESSENGDPEDEVVSDLSGKERSVARISPMPREDGGELTPMPRFRKSLRSRIPLPSPVAIKPPPRTYRNRSYSEADGGNAINTEEVPDKVSREEPDDTDGENIRDRYSEFEEERIPRKTQSSQEVRPRGSYWACSTSPSLATSDFERSQTLRPNRSRSTGRKSPAGTPRTTPRGTPRSTPRGTPRDTPRGGSLRRQYPQSKTPPTFRSRECAIVPLPEWNRLREVLSSGEQSRQSTRPPSPSEFSYTSRRSSNEFPMVHSPKWEIPVTTPKPSRWRADGRVPSHLKKKYSSMNDMGHSEDFYPSDQNLAKPGIAKPETDSPWAMQSPIRASSSQSVPHTDRYGGANKSANPLGERSFTDASTSRRRPSCVSETTTEFPMSSTGDVSAIWTEDDTMASSNFSIPAKKKSWKRRLSIRRKKSVDPSKDQGKEPEEVRRKKSVDPSKEHDKEPEEEKREKKKRKNWLLRILGIRK